MRTHFVRTCYGLMTLLTVLAGCSTGMPTQPDAPSAVGPVLSSAATPSSSSAISANSSRPPFVFPDGCCYYNDTVVRTVVPPASTPKTGRDNFYAIMNGVLQQKGVVAVAPGASQYHGGHWKFFAVTFTVTPYLLTSEAAVLAANVAGDVTITRDPNADFRCPIQP